MFYSIRLLAETSLEEGGKVVAQRIIFCTDETEYLVSRSVYLNLLPT